MAAVGLVILSSSPRGPLATRTSCSPVFPSPANLFKRRYSDANGDDPVSVKAGRKGGGDAEEASKSTKRSANLSIQPSIGAKTSGQDLESVERNCKDGDSVIKQPAAKRRKSTPKVAEEAKVRKPRAKKGDEQSKIKAGKVTKPTRTSKSLEKSTIEVLVPEEFRSIDDFLIDSAAGSNNIKGYAINKAIRRRTDWTPPRENTEGTNLSEDLAGESMEAGQSGDEGNSTKSIRDLCGAFGYTKKSSGKATEKRFPPPESGQVMSNKRRIEMVKSAIPASETSPILKKGRTKAPKKKATTITGQATAQYVAEDPKLSTTPLLEYLQTQPGALLDPDAKDTSGINKPAPKRCRAKATPAAKRSSKKAPAPASSLLAPDTALKQIKEQGFLFGTSSQLAAEQSPTMIRQVQEAIRISEDAADYERAFEASQAFEASPICPTMSPTLLGNGRHSPAGRSNLWSAAARGLNGSLIETERVDLTDSPKIDLSKGDAQVSLMDLANRSVSLTEPTQASTEDDSWFRIDDEPTDADSGPIASLKVDEGQRLTEGAQPVPSVDEPCPASKAKIPKKRKPKASLAGAGASVAGISEPSTTLPSLQRPNFEGYPTAHLSKELTGYGFKVMKNRKQMISLLEKCWESKHRDVLQALNTNVQIGNTTGVQEDKSKSRVAEKGKSGVQNRQDSPNDSQGLGLGAKELAAPVETPTKRKRGRPKKIVTECEEDAKTAPTSKQRTPRESKIPTADTIKSTTATVEEISDSDNPPTPSPPRRRSPKSSNLSLPLQLTTPPRTVTGAASSIDNSEPDATPEDVSASVRQAQLFKNITRAIRAQSRCTVRRPPLHLTWHEKILLYDPIVLEDLAVWLNTEGLGIVDVDQEVAAAEVKAWCEERSICCLWKENLRGNTRSRH